MGSRGQGPLTRGKGQGSSSRGAQCDTCREPQPQEGRDQLNTSTVRQQGSVMRKSGKDILPAWGLGKRPQSFLAVSRKSWSHFQVRNTKEGKQTALGGKATLLPQAAQEQAHRLTCVSQPLPSAAGTVGRARHLHWEESLGPHSPRLSPGPERLQPASCHPVG